MLLDVELIDCFPLFSQNAVECMLLIAALVELAFYQAFHHAFCYAFHHVILHSFFNNFVMHFIMYFVMQFVMHIYQFHRVYQQYKIDMTICSSNVLFCKF